MNEKAETLSGKMDAPSGLDLNPRPPRSVRVSKRAAGTLMAIAAVILGLFAYGGYKRQQRQVATLAEGRVPHNVAPATAAQRSRKTCHLATSRILRNKGLRRPIRAFCNHRVICNRRKRASCRVGNLQMAGRFSFGKHRFLRSLLQSRCRRFGSHLRRSAVCLPLTRANSRPSSRPLRRGIASDHQAPGSTSK